MRARILTLLLALPCVGCLTPRAMGQIKGAIRAEDLLQAPQILAAIETGRELGAALAGTLTLVFALYSGFYALHGGSGERHGLGALVRSFLYGTLACAYVLATANHPRLGLDQWAREFGTALGDAFKPSGDPFAEFTQGVALLATRITELEREVGSAGPADPMDPSWTAAAAAGSWYLSVPGVLLMVVNGTAAWVMSLVLQSVHAWLVTLYTMLVPVLAPSLILPLTRRIFYGWLKAYLSLCLWPMMFGLCERVVGAVKWGLMFSLLDATAVGNPLDKATAVESATVSLLIINIVFFFVYLSVPVASYMIVNAAGRPFRGAV